MGASTRVAEWCARFGAEVDCPIGVGPNPHDVRVLLADRAALLATLKEIAEGGFDCAPRQFYMAAQARAVEAITQAEAS